MVSLHRYSPQYDVVFYVVMVSYFLLVLLSALHVCVNDAVDVAKMLRFMWKANTDTEHTSIGYFCCCSEWLAGHAYQIFICILCTTHNNRRRWVAWYVRRVRTHKRCYNLCENGLVFWCCFFYIHSIYACVRCACVCATYRMFDEIFVKWTEVIRLSLSLSLSTSDPLDGVMIYRNRFSSSASME